jgi:Domain of unknown function (DUF4844)
MMKGQREFRVLPKVLMAVLVTGAVVFGAGLSGALFSVWPVFWPDQSLILTSEAIAELQSLREERKFVPDPRIPYPGTSPERRLAFELLVNGLIDTLIRDLPAHPTKSAVLSRMKVVLASYPAIDTEDRDRLLRYFEQILRILKIENSNELFNVWRYGFPFGWVRGFR